MTEVYICAVCKHIYGAGAHIVDEQKGTCEHHAQLIKY